MHPCSVFAQEYRENPLMTEGLYYNWAIGFMSGYNSRLAMQSREFNRKNLMGRDLMYQLAFLRNYCHMNPLHYYLQAAVALYDDLPDIK